MLMTSKLLRCFTVVSIGYVYVTVSALALTSVYITLPTFYSESLPRLVTWVITGAILLVNVVANYYLIRSRNSFYVGARSEGDACEKGRVAWGGDGGRVAWGDAADGVLPRSVSENGTACQNPASSSTPLEATPPSWSFCAECRFSVPPRTHHCAICRHCITARDHHCFFTGSCVGAGNQRFFVRFLAHCALGSVYTMYLNTRYLHHLHDDGARGGAAYYRYALPVAFVEWLAGSQTGEAVLFTGLLYAGLMTFIGTTALLIFQLFLVARGLTSYKFSQRKPTPWLHKDTWPGLRTGALRPFFGVHCLLPLELCGASCPPMRGRAWGDELMQGKVI